MAGLQKTGTHLVMQKIWPHFSCILTLPQEILSHQGHHSLRNLSQPMRTNHATSVGDSNDTTYTRFIKANDARDSQRREQPCFLMPLANGARNAFISYKLLRKTVVNYGFSATNVFLISNSQHCACYSLFRNKRLCQVWG